MNPILQEHLTSAFQTFLSTFLTVAGATLLNGNIEWTGAFWGALVLVAARAAIKEVFAQVGPKALGGRK